MSLLAQLTKMLDSLELPVETGIFQGQAPDVYVVITPLSDVFEGFADDGPHYETQEARLSLFCKGNYGQHKNRIIWSLLGLGITITDRRYIGYEEDTLGIKTVFDPSGAPLCVVLYQGETAQAVFSKEYENVIDQIYTQSYLDYANSALIGGEGEGDQRSFATISGGTGEDRYEMFVDAKDLRAEDFGEDYISALLFRGEGRLNEHAAANAFDTSVNPYGNLEYKRDYDLGSVVQVQSQRWNLNMRARITEVEESYDADGRSLRVVFGKPMLSLMKKLKGDD